MLDYRDELYPNGTRDYNNKGHDVKKEDEWKEGLMLNRDHQLFTLALYRVRTIFFS